MAKKGPVKVAKKEASFHQMNDVLMHVAKMYARQHGKMQDFGVSVGLCREEIHTVQAIGNHEGINLTELATLLEVRKPTISARVKKLIKLKLVHKHLKDGNQKEVELALTEQGWLAYESHEKQHRELYQRFRKHFGSQTDEIVASFSTDLERFVGFLNEMREETTLFQ